METVSGPHRVILKEGVSRGPLKRWDNNNKLNIYDKKEIH